MKKTNNLFKLALLLGLSSSLFACQFAQGNISVNSSTSSSSSLSLPVVSQPEDATLVQSINFKYDTYKVGYGKSMSVVPGVLPVGATYQTLYYESSDTNIFTVNTRGYITGVEIGEAYLTCYALDGSGVTGTTKIVVFGTEVTSIRLNYSSRDIGVGEKFTLIPTFNPADASYKVCNWSSSNDKVAMVDENGLVTGIAPGKCVIRASSKTNANVYAECEINVTYVELVNFHFANKQIYLHEGENRTLRATYSPRNASYTDLTYVSSDTGVAVVNANGNVTAKKPGTAVITATSHDKKHQDTCIVEVFKSGSNIKTSLDYTYLDYGYNSIYPMSHCPSIGNINALVIPVWFKDSTNFIDQNKRDGVRNDIETAFNGSESATGWNSVKTFYKKESHDRCAFNAFVTSWFECGASYSDYKTDSNNTARLTSVAHQWFTTMYPENDIKDFDSDRDGLIDAMILIYAAPDYSASRDWGSQNLWAYCSWTMEAPNFDKPKVSGFMWASYDFMYGREKSQQKTGKPYGSGKTSHMNIDSHTYIHEFGHLFGLSDYYDYSQQYSASGAFSMQDYNVGGHDPYSMMALGWVDPYIVNKYSTIHLNAFSDFGDVILITPSWNKDNSPFDEYILVELYTPTGVNWFDSSSERSVNYIGLPDPGIRIWHVDARLVVGEYRNIEKSTTFTTNPSTELGSVYHMMSNTYDSSEEDMTGRISVLGKKYADYNLLQLIRNDKEMTYRPDSAIRSSDLFRTDDTFTMKDFQSQFKNGLELNSGKDFNFEIYFDEVTSEDATVTITRI